MKQPSGNPDKKLDACADNEKEKPDKSSATPDAGANPFRTLESQKARRLPIPRGVYRFKTHEETDAWMEKMLARGKGSKPQDSGTK
jgi:hypothetical protein